ncbi:MAG: cytochrome c biogenesis protein CcmG/thiol:disulfide interchange protein DsbE [Paraglaciecola sp.]|jgi:cytochrome c biogenesis protein CcmG/thiol:disulfide interchange protein DsbE
MFRILFFALLLTSINFANASPAAVERLEAPQWQLYNEAEQLVDSTDFAGKPLIIHFWATWCPYCKKLQPGLDKLYKKYQADGLQLIAISFREDEGATPQAVLDERGMSFSTVVNGEQVAKDLFSVTGTPTTVFIDRLGRIVTTTRVSDPDDPRLEKIVKALLDK